MKHLIKQILKEQTKSVTCECGWSWKLSEGGDDPYVCHKCGKDNSKKYLKESVDNRIVDILIKLKLPNYWEIEEFLTESGYNEDEIKEIYSNYFKTISGLDLTPVNWMNFYFSPDQLESYSDVDYPNVIFYLKNGEVVMNENIRYEAFWFYYEGVWSFFEMFFDMKYAQIQEVLSYWVKNTFNKDYYVNVTSNN